jgi:hypothetical protein
MDQMSIARTEKEHSTGGRDQPQGGVMGYRWRDLVVLVLARVTRARIATVHRILWRIGWR